MNHTKKHQVIVSIYPTSRGLGFSVFDTPRNLLDWGCSDIRVNKTARTLKKLKVLIDLYRPETIVLEDTGEDTSKRATRIKKLITAITNYALEANIPVQHYTEKQAGEVFAVANKDTRAKDITKVLPELEPYLPPMRRVWDNQHPRMQIFDAAALALTYFYLET